MTLVKRTVFGSLISILCLPGCGNMQQEPKTATQKYTGLVVVNVLDKQLFDDCHIKGSINIPCDEVARCETCIDKDADIVIYCSNYLCSSSDYVARKLKESGFKNVAVYAGGTAEWFQRGLPVEGPSKSKYLFCSIESVNIGQEGIVVVDELAKKLGVNATTKVAQKSHS
jgi:rhodanese-related sulfurtransferase